MQTLILTLKDFTKFLKNPVEQQDTNQSFQQKRKVFFLLLLLNFLVAGIVSVVALIVEEFGINLTETNDVMKMMEQFPVWIILLFGVIILPFIEELIFRLPLISRYDLSTRLIILCAAITGRRNKLKVTISLRRFWRKHYGKIFYLFAILFGLVHVTNYEISLTILLFAPLLIASQFVGGLIMGYLRVRYNFTLGFIFHAVFNGIIFGITLISMHLTADKWDFEEEYCCYSIKIKEASFLEKQSYTFSNSIDRDSVIIKGTSLITIINTLLDKDEFLTETNNLQLANKKINLTFMNHSKGNHISKDLILEKLSDLYNFDFEILNKEHKVWKLIIQDSSKLMQHKTKIEVDTNSNNLYNQSYTSKVVERADKIELEYVGLSTLAHSLKTHYKEYIIFTGNDKERFDFTITAKDFSSLANFINQNYGLSIEKTILECEYININFRKDK